MKIVKIYIQINGKNNHTKYCLFVLFSATFCKQVLTLRRSVKTFKHDIRRLFFDKLQCSLPKTVEFSFVLSSTVVKTVGAQINAIRFIFFEADVRTFEIRITA